MIYYRRIRDRLLRRQFDLYAINSASEASGFDDTLTSSLAIKAALCETRNTSFEVGQWVVAIRSENMLKDSSSFATR